VPPVDYSSSKGTGFIGGGQIGCDYQFTSNWVIGIQGGVDFGNINSTNPVVVVPGITAVYRLKSTEEFAARLVMRSLPQFLLTTRVAPPEQMPARHLCLPVW
jgi:outer membrane immunogenic protein